MSDGVITSLQNKTVKHIAQLVKSAKYRKENRLFTIEGLRILKDCCENSVDFEILLLTKEFSQKFFEESAVLQKNAKQVLTVSEEVLAKISDTQNPQGVLAVIKMRDATASVIEKKGKYIALENISDPSNLGAISRTAEALGISGIILSESGCDPYSPKVMRASMGTLLRMPVIIFKDFKNELINSGLSAYPCVVRNGKRINTVEFKPGSVLVIGNEANGLSDDTAKVGTPVTIPMKGSAESLNAAAAAAIAMWELMK